MLLPAERVLASRNGPDGPRSQRKADALSINMFEDLLESASGEARSEAASSTEEDNDASSNVAATPPVGFPFSMDISFLQVMPGSAPPQGALCARPERGGQGEETQPLGLVDGQGILDEAVANTSAVVVEMEPRKGAGSNDEPDAAEGLRKEPAGRSASLQMTSGIGPSLDVGIETDGLEGQKPPKDCKVKGKAPEPSPSNGKIITPPDLAASQIPIAPPSSPPIRQVLPQLDRLFQSTHISPIAPITPAKAGGEVRSLRLTLRPDHLGDVEVSLHRAGNEMRVRIVVTNHATARSLEENLNLLRDKIDQLMQTEGVPAVTVSIQASDEKPQSVPDQGSGNGAGMTASNGSLADSMGERQAPRKRVAGSNQSENDPPDRDPLLHPGLAHIVV